MCPPKLCIALHFHIGYYSIGRILLVIGSLLLHLPLFRQDNIIISLSYEVLKSLDVRGKGITYQLNHRSSVSSVDEYGSQ